MLYVLEDYVLQLNFKIYEFIYFKDYLGNKIEGDKNEQKLKKIKK